MESNSIEDLKDKDWVVFTAFANVYSSRWPVTTVEQVSGGQEVWKWAVKASAARILTSLELLEGLLEHSFQGPSPEVLIQLVPWGSLRIRTSNKLPADVGIGGQWTK